MRGWRLIPGLALISRLYQFILTVKRFRSRRGTNFPFKRLCVIVVVAALHSDLEINKPWRISVEKKFLMRGSFERRWFLVNYSSVTRLPPRCKTFERGFVDSLLLTRRQQEGERALNRKKVFKLRILLFDVLYLRALLFSFFFARIKRRDWLSRPVSSPELKINHEQWRFLWRNHL